MMIPMNDHQTNADSETPAKGPERIAAYVKNLPDAPGVYRMMDGKGDVLYVGKAKSLEEARRFLREIRRP